MEQMIQTIVTVIVAIMASSGFWAFVMSNKTSKSAESKMLLGLGHDRIISLCKEYISKGYITTDEFENLNKYLYEPYVDMGGNGSAKRLMDEVKKLPIKD